jgi:hypothetical protein
MQYMDSWGMIIPQIPHKCRIDLGAELGGSVAIDTGGSLKSHRPVGVLRAEDKLMIEIVYVYS